MGLNVNKVVTATKWSIITEFVVKFISPISSMILARLISPSEFGVAATVVMIVSLADVFTEAGFQRYIVQHLFRNNQDEDESINVAFWTNLIISIFLWLLIFIFSDSLASLVGNPGRGKVIWIGALILPLTSFGSIQTAVFRKRLNFKDIAWVRIAVKLVPLVVVAPLAFLGFSFWSLIIGNILSELINAVVLTIRSDWKPRFFYSFAKLKEMVSFCLWGLCESLSSWLITNLGIFIIGQMFNDYYLGLYKTATTTVNQIISIITASTMGVLLSALSNVQNDSEEYAKIYFGFLKGIGIFTIPLGTGILLYDRLVCNILLGSQWDEATIIIGIWGFILAETVIFNSMSGSVILSKGQPKALFWSNVSQALLMIPAFYYGGKLGFNQMVIITSIVRIELGVVQTVIASKISDIKVRDIFKVINKYIVATMAMTFGALALRKVTNSFLSEIISVVLCIFIYFCVLYILPDGREELKQYISVIKKKLSNKVV